ncbi:DUF4350 domain-containing protein [Gracilibacillus caseinilyticus]|uniref:DUF4350 domain-containing protein n=1 Tax=Gracilibacillus caseinilyticus TaxID=2932256 RepID=A0ABY4EXR9_9BACI|nr:DUF4350 domain-containing protein [Gracilibacillus caseinilyticus]UOQ49210.1 DUF4350 domain-containing protein [Gracilibacillus caseinilyticus]
MFRNKTWIVGIVFFIILIAVSYYSSSNAPEQYPDYAIESPSLTGVKGLYTYLSDQGYQTSIVKQAPAQQEDTLRLLVNPPVFTDQGVATVYMDYMKQGNTLVVAKENPDGLLGIKTEYALQGMLPDSEETSDIQINGMTRKAVYNTPIRLVANGDDQILAEDEYGPLAIKKQIGDGSLIILTEPDWFTNGQILDQDHLAIILETVPFDQFNHVVFDRYSVNDAGAQASTFELYPGWAYVLLVQGIVLTLLIFWYQGKRFGPIYPVREETVRFSNERSKAIAIWLVKGRNYQASLQYQMDYLKEIIRMRFGIPYHKDWHDRLRDIESHIHSIKPNELKKLASELENLQQQPSLNKQQYLYWSQQMDKIRDEVK